MGKNRPPLVASVSRRLLWRCPAPTDEGKRQLQSRRSRQSASCRLYRTVFATITLLVASLATLAASSAQEVILQFEPSKTTAEITLTGNMHTVEGSFAFKRGSIHFSPATGAVSGEIVFDATSGRTGNGSRDHKMHKDVLESQLYPEIIFRPDRAEGTFSLSGTSTLQVHGMFAIHGTEHAVTFPVGVSANGSSWTAKSSFDVPYTNWGMKNPSKLFLRVSNVVHVQFHAVGGMVP
jgi:polyisoprenoid-binding protein YceI